MNIKTPLALGAALFICYGCGITDGPSYNTRNEIKYFENNQNAIAVFGSSDFTTVVNGTSATAAKQFNGVTFDTAGNLYAADNGNDRVMFFPAGTTAATFTYGQNGVNAYVNAGSPLQTNFRRPEAIRVIDSKLFVLDREYGRVMVFPTPLTSNQPNAIVALGRASFTEDHGGSPPCTGASLYRPFGLDGANGKIAVGSANQNRVLIYNSLPSSMPNTADVVIGQPNATTCTSGTTRSKLSSPKGIWTDGTRLVIADSGNDRVLIWNTFPTTTGQDADLVLGQSDFTSSGWSTSRTGVNNPWGITSDGTMLVLADSDNNRVLIWNKFPTTNNQAADVVLGQVDFDTADWPLTPAQNTFDSPTDVALHGGKLYVADSSNSRLMVFEPKTEVTE